METVIVSSGFRVVIPKKLRAQLDIKVGQKLKIRMSGAHIELISDQPISAARGFLPSLDSVVEREERRV